MENIQEINMRAKIFSFVDGMKEYEKVKLIRLHSRDYKLLIMEDHLPMIGELDGNVEIVAENDQIILEDIKGFYMHKKNVFELILKE